MSNIVIGYGQSLDKHVFFKTSDKDYKTGHYVVIQTDKSDPFAKGHLITKKIGCSPSEILMIQGDDYFCGDKYLGRAKHYSKTGIPVKPFNPCTAYVGSKFKIQNLEVCEYIVPEKQYFVIGTHKDSYDSRYFGFVPEDRIVFRVIPLW